MADRPNYLDVRRKRTGDVYRTVDIIFHNGKWIPNPDAKFFRIDQPGEGLSPEAPKDIFQPGELLPLGGAVVGGLAGAAIPFPFAGTAGAALGAFAGESLRGGIPSLQSVVSPSPERKFIEPSEIYQKAGQRAMQAGALELGGAGLGKLARYGIRAVRGALPAPKRSLRALAEREDINLPIGARTESPALQATETMLVRTPGGAAISEERMSAVEKFVKFFKKTGARFINADLSREKLGLGAMKSFEVAKQSKNALSTSLYDDLESYASGSLASKKSDALETIDKVLGEAKISRTSSGRIVGGLGVLQPENYRTILNVRNRLTNPGLTYSDLKNMRTSIGDLFDPSKPKLHGLEATYKKIYGDLSKDMERTAVEGGYGEIMNEANTFYKNFMSLLENPKVARILSKKTPESLVEDIVETNNPSDIRLIMNEFDEPGKNYLRKQFLESIFEKSYTEKLPSEAVTAENLPVRLGAKISPSKVASALNKYSKETLQELFGDTIHVVEDIQTLANALKRGESFRFGSPTAPIEDIKLAMMMQAYALTSRISSRIGLSKFLTSELGKQMLTEPIEPLRITEQLARTGTQIGGSFLLPYSER